MAQIEQLNSRQIVIPTNASTGFPSRSYARDIVLVVGVAVVYFAAAELGLSFAFIHTNVSPVWPPTGIALVAVLLFGNRVWPGILLGAFVANVITPIPMSAAVAIAAGNTLEAIGAGVLLRSAKFNNSIDEAKDVFKLLLVMAVCAALGASVGTAALCISGAASWSNFPRLWSTWWLGDLTGALTVAPLLLAWIVREEKWLPWKRSIEAVLLLTLLSLSAIVTWGQSAPVRVQFYPLTRLIVPFFLWAAFRLGHRGVTLAIASISAFAVWGTINGSGPFISATPNDSLLVLQLFIGSNAVTFLLLVAVVDERSRAEKAVRDKESELEQITQSTPLMLTRCTPDLRYRFVNKAYAALLGRRPEQIIGSRIEDIIGPVGFNSILPYIERVLQGEHVEFEQEVAYRDIGPRFMRVSYRPDRDAKGNVIGWISSISDITKTKASEDALRNSERQLSEFFENASEAIHWVGPSGTILRANRAELRMLGYTAEEYIGRDIADFHVDKNAIADILGRLRNGETLENYTASMICKDGSVRQVVINSSGYFENGEFVHTRCFTRDITEQLQNEKALRHLAAIVESTDDVIISKDLDGSITSWNAAAERVYGYTAEEMIGRSVSILIPPDKPDEETTMLEKLTSGERIDHYESVRIAKDGRRIDVSLTVSPIHDANGNVIGASKISRDITELKRAQEEREELLAREEKARAEAEAANRVKDEFLATLSHELRTPLNAIMGWAGMLSGGKLNQVEVARAIEIIDRNAKVQSRLIEGVLDVSRIVSGKFQIEHRPVQLREVVTAAVDSIRPTAQARDLKLHLEMENYLPMVGGDSNRLQQVVWNLLSNAVKFTDPGGEIRVGLTTVGSQVEIEVRDTGQGIRSEFLPYVFERFRQEDSSTTRKHGGLGLGLAIVRHLVELHGGCVEAISDGEGKGATFRVQLPILNANTSPPLRQPKQERPDATKMLRGLRILIVEDQHDALEVMVEMLSRCEADVKAVGSARDALDVLSKWKPEVLLSDISMPELDGYAFIQQVRVMESERLTRNVAMNGMIPAIALTAHARDEDRQRALESGFHAYLSKPVELSELAECIAKVTGKLSRSR